MRKTLNIVEKHQQRPIKKQDISDPYIERYQLSGQIYGLCGLSNPNSSDSPEELYKSLVYGLLKKINLVIFNCAFWGMCGCPWGPEEGVGSLEAGAMGEPPNRGTWTQIHQSREVQASNHGAN